MKLKHIFVSLMCGIFLVTTNMKPVAVANELEHVNEQVIVKTKNVVSRLASNNEDISDTEDPNVVFERAIKNYSIEFRDYINITGLNVLQKDLIKLPNFDVNYVVPDYTDIMHDYQVNFESSLTTEELNKFVEMRRSNYEFDKYATLNEIKYKNLNVKPKYAHRDSIQVQRAAVVVSGLTAILAGAGLTQTVINAFTGCVSALSTALSTSWIPFVGWTIAVALVVGALIAITVIIVQHWDEIKAVINDIKDWFVEQFNSFANWINSYFGDAIAKGEESTIAERQVIGDKELVWKDASMTRDVAIAVATDLRRDPNDVLLMKNISFPRKNEMNWWIPSGYVSKEFVTINRLYEAPYFFSTYTWYNNTAKNLLLLGAPNYAIYGGFGNKNLVYHKFTEMKNAVYGWNHYHMGMYDPTALKAKTYPQIKDSNGNTIPSIHDVHCFFGLTYVRLADNQGFISYPANP